MIRETMNLSGITPLNREQIEHLVQVASRFAARVTFEINNRSINGKSMLGLLSLGMTGEEPVSLICEGEDEEEAAQEIRVLLEGGVAPPKSMVDAKALMQVIKDKFVSLLTANLVGIYLYGSLASDCFHWDGGDIDFLVVVRDPLTVEKKIALIETLYALSPDAPPEGFEMWVILEKYCRDMPYPIPYELHYTEAYKREYERDAWGFCERMHGEDPALTRHILTITASGIVIHGPSIARVFDHVKREDALSAIRAHISGAADHLHERPVYYVLNLCRAVAYLREGRAMSKKEGGEWALHHMDSAHQRVIQAALNAYETGLGVSYDEGQAEDFCFDALEELSL